MKPGSSELLTSLTSLFAHISNLQTWALRGGLRQSRPETSNSHPSHPTSCQLCGFPFIGVTARAHYAFSISPGILLDDIHWQGSVWIQYPCMSLGLATPSTGSLRVFTFHLLGSISWNSAFFRKENEVARYIPPPSGLNDIVVIEGKIYQRNPYVSNFEGTFR